MQEKFIINGFAHRILFINVHRNAHDQGMNERVVSISSWSQMARFPRLNKYLSGLPTHSRTCQTFVRSDRSRFSVNWKVIKWQFVHIGFWMIGIVHWYVITYREGRRTSLYAVDETRDKRTFQFCKLHLNSICDGSEYFKRCCGVFELRFAVCYMSRYRSLRSELFLLF